MLPQPLRVFAALTAMARLVVTPDSGPMHLVVAVGVPTVVLLQAERSLHYAPRGPNDRFLMCPSVAEVVATIIEHPSWAALTSQSAAPSGDTPPIS
ncbi:MAG: glycosyltransferase family 9 protein, partial [Candidatus Binatia bacterium]